MSDFNPSTLTDISNSFSKYIVSPINAFGVGGFVFDIDGENSANLTAEITDHYTEDNTTIQDHIALKPKKITLKSYVGEVRDAVDADTNSQLQSLAQKLTVISALLPRLASAESQIASVASSIASGGIKSGITNNFSSLTNNAVNLWNLVKNTAPQQGRQAQAYAYFKALYEQKIMVSVQTPFEFMSQMVIESIMAMQPEESKNISHFTITLKEIRIASTKVQTASSNGQDAPQAQGRTQQQGQGYSVIGDTSGINPKELNSMVRSLPALPIGANANVTFGPEFNVPQDVIDSAIFKQSKKM